MVWPGARALVIAACLSGVGFPVAAMEMEWTASDDLTLGPDKYRSDTAELGLASTDDFSGYFNLGVSRTVTPFQDTTGSIGLGLMVGLSKSASISFNCSGYQGAKASIVNPATNEIVGEAGKRRTSGSLGAALEWKFVNITGEEDADRRMLKGTFGLSAGRHDIPLWTGETVETASQVSIYRISDTGITAGLAGSIGNTGAGLTVINHSYKFPSPAGDLRPRQAALLLRLPPASVTTSVQGLPSTIYTVVLKQRLPWGFRLRGSYDYETLIRNPDTSEVLEGKKIRVVVKGNPDGIARISTVELSWEPVPWAEVTGGSYWINEDHVNSRYTTLGLSLYF
jgi:hypothetical protein